MTKPHNTPDTPQNPTPRNKITIKRIFTQEGKHPYDLIDWDHRDIVQTNWKTGEEIFRQEHAEFPTFWSENAATIVTTKYFRGAHNTPQRETSLKQLINRIVHTYTAAAKKYKYITNAKQLEIFEHELTHLLLHQYFSFNSPVWFNVGTPSPAQVSACFILGVEDSMDSILNWYREEGLIFKGGSGAGINLSNLRSSKELLKNSGGTSSGPVSFMRGADASAGTIKSGGACLAPWTKVYTNAGTHHVEKLAETEEDFTVISYNPAKKQLETTQARAWLSGYKQLIRLTTNKGQFTLSKDHPVLLTTGEYTPLENLTENQKIRAGAHNTETDTIDEDTHTVISLQQLDSSAVYDIEVDSDTPRDKTPQDGHNFLIISETDDTTGIIVSNTRRAAKMVILDIDHPDIEEFINTKKHEEEKIRVLRDAGFDMDLGGKDIVSVQYQNANNSVRVDDKFMEAVKNETTYDLIARSTHDVTDTVDAKALFRSMADAAWACADPGIHYKDAINKWHTNKNTGPITASNPCFTGDTLVAVADGRGAVPIRELAEQGKDVPVFCSDVDGNVTVGMLTRTRLTRYDTPVLKITLDDGSTLRVTYDHPVMMRDGKFRPAETLQPGDQLMPFDAKVSKFATHDRRSVRAGKNWELAQQLAVGRKRGDNTKDGRHVHHLDGDSLNDHPDNLVVLTQSDHRSLHANKNHPLNTDGTNKNRQARLEKLRDTVTGNGNPNYRHGRYNEQAISVTRPCPQCGNDFTAIARQHTCSIECRDAWRAENPYITILACSECETPFESYNGSGLYCTPECQKEAHDRRRKVYTRECPHCNGHFDTTIPTVQYCSRSCASTAAHIRKGRVNDLEYLCGHCGETFTPRRKESKYCNSSCAARARVAAQKAAPYAHNHRVVAVEADGRADVYDGEVPGLHNFAVVTSIDGDDPRTATLSGIFGRQCSEFLSLDNASCNLASLNLLKFRKKDGTFDVDNFVKTVEFVIVAMDVSISFADFPTEKITDTTRRFRQLGIGYTNLGALLMSSGVGYDSPEGRAFAAAITSLMSAVAYRRSAELAGAVGAYDGFAENAEPHTEVMRLHADASTEFVATLHGNADEGAGFIEDGVVGPFRLANGVAENADDEWQKNLALGEKYGWRNAQISLLAPTGCLVPDTLVATSDGLLQLSEIGDVWGNQWQNLSSVDDASRPLSVATDEGSRVATQFFVNGEEATRQLVTKYGSTIQGTLTHRVKVWDEKTRKPVWKRLMDVVPGDRVAFVQDLTVGDSRRVVLPVPNVSEVVVPSVVSEQLAELAGLFASGGSVTANGLTWNVSSSDLDVVSHIQRSVKELFACDSRVDDYGEGGMSVTVDSSAVAQWWEVIGFASGVPLVVRETNDPKVWASYLRGVFEANVSELAVVAVSERFAHQVATVMRACGVAPAVAQVEGNGPGWKVSVRDENAQKVWDATVGSISNHVRVLPVENDNPSDEDYRTSLGDGTYAYEPVVSNVDGGVQPTYDISVPDNVTYTANGMVSHNTISFMLDADTMGVEPDFSLVKFKKLVGGGSMRIVNQQVGEALRFLGYGADTVKNVEEYLIEHGTVEGAPGLAREHYHIFDCAIGDRAISPMGHILMMAAIQPFLSGATSKSVNMPSSATVEDIEEVYYRGWELGLKALAIYRDGSKVGQPLSDGKKKKEDDAESTSDDDAAEVKVVERVVEKFIERPARRKLPKKRSAETVSFSVAGSEGYLTAGMYEDGTIGELFVKMSKQGSTLAGIMDAFSIAVSLGLQHGVPLEAYIGKFTNMRFEPSGMTDDPDVRMAQSLVDYMFRRIALDHLPFDVRSAYGIYTTKERTDALNGTVDAEDEVPDQGEIAPVARGSADVEKAHDTGGEKPAKDQTAQSRSPFDSVAGEPGTGKHFSLNIDPPLCGTCGVFMTRTGACWACPACGSTTGCS